MGIVFIDMKTTGRNPVLDKIFYIEITQFDNNLVPKKTYTTWLNPENKLSKAQERFFGISNKEIRQFPLFEDVAKEIHKLLKNQKIGTLNKEVDVVEFLKEEFLLTGLKLDYLKRDVVVLDTLEEYIYPRDISNLYYKYTGTKVREKESYTKEMGEVLKHQMNVLKMDLETFNYKKIIDNNMQDLETRFLYQVGDILYLNFGKFKDIDVREVRKSYIDFILESDFPLTVKNKITEYLDR